ncbi:hypothetical protein B0T09DRAFT_21094 [Sordaria sp. MPI-SDFR-AT-0083]|nr:hypothetical protein B0T09DRAFT_21094 [Sordaria sp. MPI-SDFR-AT-0083]
MSLLLRPYLPTYSRALLTFLLPYPHDHPLCTVTKFSLLCLSLMINMSWSVWYKQSERTIKRYILVFFFVSFFVETTLSQTRARPFIPSRLVPVPTLNLKSCCSVLPLISVGCPCCNRVYNPPLSHF